MSTEKNQMVSGLAARLKSSREKAGLTQAQAAEIVGVDKVTVSRWENGKRTPSADDAVLLARAYKEETEWLISGTTSREDVSLYASSPFIEKVAALMADMDIETQKDICLSVEKEKLLRDLLRQMDSDKKAG